MIDLAEYMIYKNYMIPVKQWSELHQRSLNTTMNMIKTGRIQKAFKFRGHWFVDITESCPPPKKAMPSKEKRTRRIFSMLESDHKKLIELAHKHNWSAGMEIAYLINTEFKRLNINI